MLNGIHFLLTYSCTYQCDHCFLHCSPEAPGTFTCQQLRAAFTEIQRLGTIETVYFEGGEPFLYYPLLLEGLRMAAGLGLQAGIVTNCYWATSVEDAEIWLKPIRDIGIADLSVSDDAFHLSTGEGSPAKLAFAAARNLGIPCATICIQPPSPDPCQEGSPGRGQPVTGGTVLFKGRAAEKLTAGLPRRPCDELASCPHEELDQPSRVHVDCYGNVHLCQGVSMGNMWATPLSELARRYDARQHPICGPLLAGGPAALAKEYGVQMPDGFVDECHYCYAVRKSLIDRFPAYLAPRQVYGTAS
ncbi:MAG TPA: radical SAM protein [Bryobacteraceae bacterium]|nr:radical SAM protein [Bryobacteraceae bacterium]